MSDKTILDACCGSRMFWFDRNNPDVVFADNRYVSTTLCDGRTLVIRGKILVGSEIWCFAERMATVLESRIFRMHAGFKADPHVDHEMEYGTNQSFANA